ncbi:MAG: hypothetical protein J5493_07150 [Lachnospiraceae bacterium]|nr:hypothetical protein [Lachnospiraceae bacterium]
MNKKKLMCKMTACLLILVLILSLTACGGGKPSGTYVSKGLITQSYTFSGDSVTISAFGINATGTYTIKDGKLNITYSLLGLEQTISYSYEKKGNSIFIDGTEFIKQ